MVVDSVCIEWKLDNRTALLLRTSFIHFTLNENWYLAKATTTTTTTKAMPTQISRMNVSNMRQKWSDDRRHVYRHLIFRVEIFGAFNYSYSSFSHIFAAHKSHIEVDGDEDAIKSCFGGKLRECESNWFWQPQQHMYMEGCLSAYAQITFSNQQRRYVLLNLSEAISVSQKKIISC